MEPPSLSVPFREQPVRTYKNRSIALCIRDRFKQSSLFFQLLLIYWPKGLRWFFKKGNVHIIQLLLLLQYVQFNNYIIRAMTWRFFWIGREGQNGGMAGRLHREAVGCVQQGGSKTAIITACQPHHEDVIREGAGSVREHPPTDRHRYSSEMLVT